MYEAIWVGVGGFIGAILRYVISGYIQNLSQSVSFPYGTLAVNVIGCVFIGTLSHLAEIKMGITTEMRLLLMIGLLGSFTTFSTFGNETVNLLQDHGIFAALINLGAHIFLGLLGVFLGRVLGILLWR